MFQRSTQKVLIFFRNLRRARKKSWKNWGETDMYKNREKKKCTPPIAFGQQPFYSKKKVQHLSGKMATYKNGKKKKTTKWHTSQLKTQSRQRVFFATFATGGFAYTKWPFLQKQKKGKQKSKNQWKSSCCCRGRIWHPQTYVDEMRVSSANTEKINEFQQTRAPRFTTTIYI